MKIKNKKSWVVFKEIFYEKKSLNQWRIINKKKEQIGLIMYYNSWKQHVFSPAPDPNIIISEGCLEEIRDFIIRRNTNKKLKTRR